jgi:queuine tRNA-ribosyltransferase
VSGPLRFEVEATCSESGARLGRVETPHGGFDTPAFMPVGTQSCVKGLWPDQVAETGSQIILNNAYHLMLRPGDAAVARRGGCHQFMRWSGPILTDSGGYQAYSMAHINRLDEDGVRFRSIVDGAWVDLGPERSMEVQNNIGADIIMAFDDCPPAGDPKEVVGFRKRVTTDGHRGLEHHDRLRDAHERTVRWLDRCVKAHQRPSDQALFGIVQGGTDLDLRAASVEAICQHDLPGFAVGGVAVGERPEQIAEVVAFTAPRLPAQKPRYLMGVGYEQDIVHAVRSGIDMFDCVLPTRNARNAQAFTRSGRMNLKNAKFAEDDAPIDSSCDCATCTGGYSRAYIRHLLNASESMAGSLVATHNLRHFQRLMLDIRQAIRDNDWSAFRAGWPELRTDLAPLS